MSEATAYSAALLRARARVAAAERVYSEASRALSAAVARVEVLVAREQAAVSALATEWPGGGGAGGVSMWRRGLRAASADAAVAVASAEAERETRQHAKRAAESALRVAQAKVDALEKAIERQAHQRHLERRRRQDQEQ